jgi:C1A family cysteine protease
MITYEKIFDNIMHLKKRISIFIENLDFINDFNLNNSTSYTLGINKFADMSHSEYIDYVSIGKNSYTAKNSCKKMEQATGNYPASVDWRLKNAVTPVKDQGQCGSCWSFSTTGAVEGSYAINHGSLLSFSEQQLVDCSYSYGNHGCNGGLMDNAMTYIIDNGITIESEYPYTANGNRNSCQKFTPQTFLSACYDVTPNELQLTYAVAGQPVSIAIEADSRSFQLYKSGVYNDPSCGTNLDHGVLVVGYGNSKDGGDYWIVKNSWSNSWGNNGYIYIARNSVASSTSGICGIAMSPSYAEI